MKHVLIVEDITETRTWLKDIVIAAYGDVDIQLAAGVRDARHKLESRIFDLALIDIGLPDGSGIDVLRSLRTQSAPTICVVTTVTSDDATVVAALSAGADGYLLKENPKDVLTRQLVQIGSGIAPLSPPIARRIMEHFRLTGPVGLPEQALTRREKDVLTLIARGLRNSEVAQELDLAESTIAGYIKGVYRKLGISSRAEAAWHASQMGLTPPG